MRSCNYAQEHDREMAVLLRRWARADANAHLRKARLNITVPPDLYARLKAVEDQVNASKVCGEALERAVALAEARTEAVPA